MASKRTKISYALLMILYAFGGLTLLFNLIGLWAPWHLAGFGYFFFLPIPAISLIVSFFTSLFEGDGRMIFKNLRLIIFTVAVTCFTVYISATWFW